MKRHQNLLLLLAVAALLALPLRMVKKAPITANGSTSTLFAGSDDQARDMVKSIAPSYKPWAEPLMQPASIGPRENRGRVRRTSDGFRRIAAPPRTSGRR